MPKPTRDKTANGETRDQAIERYRRTVHDKFLELVHEEAEIDAKQVRIRKKSILN